MKITARILWAVCGLALVLAAGCTSAPQVAPSGFLSDYRALKPDPQIKGLYWWERPGVEWKGYTRLIIEPVQVRVAKSKSQRDLKPGEAQELARRLRAAVVKELKGVTTLTRTPGPGVLRLRAALVHVKPVNPTMNVLSTAIMMWPMDMGEAAVEAQFRDSLSNRILGELVISSQGEMTDVTRVWTRWTQVEHTFAQWAKLLRQSIQEDKR
ncbi:MAG: DUF3313 domain-containing protein [Desulfarculus sp.]|nr:MAG: DUF3313 domain-containing protein [Desulfarculus sp.]